MGKKQSGLYMGCKGAQVTVVPGWQNVFEQAWCGAVVVPSHAKSITICDPRRLSRS
jgi:hypothetical protein